MNEIIRIFHEFTPGAYGIWTGVLMFMAWWLREWRETRKLSADDRLARREGYAKQVEMLTAENRDLMADQRNLREEYDKYRRLCHEETDQLRDQVMMLEGRMSGLIRKVADVAVRAARGEMDQNMAELIISLAAEASSPIEVSLQDKNR